MPDRFVPASERVRESARQALLPTILFADADERWRAMARDALLEGRSPSDPRFATDGQDPLDYLHRRGRHLDPSASPRPALIVLNLDLPRLGGLDAVRAIRSNQQLRRIPVVALSDDDDPVAVDGEARIARAAALQQGVAGHGAPALVGVGEQDRRQQRLAGALTRALGCGHEPVRHAQAPPGAPGG